MEGEETSALDANSLYPEPPRNFNGSDVFNLELHIEDFNPSNVSTDVAIIQMKQLDVLSRRIGTVCRNCLSENIKHSIRKTIKTFFNQVLEVTCHSCRTNLGYVTVHE